LEGNKGSPTHRTEGGGRENGETFVNERSFGSEIWIVKEGGEGHTKRRTIGSSFGGGKNSHDIEGKYEKEGEG